MKITKPRKRDCLIPTACTGAPDKLNALRRVSADPTRRKPQGGEEEPCDSAVGVG